MLRVRKGRSKDKATSYLQTDGVGDSPSDTAKLVSLLAALPKETRVWAAETDYPLRIVLGAICPNAVTFRSPAGGWGEWEVV